MDFQKLNNYLNEPISNISIVVFRFVFSIILLIQTYFFIVNDFINQNIVQPLLLFPFIPNLDPISKNNLIMLGYLMLTSNIGMLINKISRISTLVFFLCFTYFWILDKGYFNNHYYFISIICFLLFIVNKKSSFNNRIYVPRISIFSLQIIIFITYFVAGINKLNPYWLFDFQPMTHILELKAHISNNPIYSQKWVIIFGVLFGVLFDLCIGFLLFFKKTRTIAFCLVLFFNISNHYIFHNIGEIGVFPFLMISTLILFIEPKRLEKLIQKKTPITHYKHNSFLKGFIYFFIFFQILVPFRHHLYKGYVDYNGIGQRFSWRMKTMYKESEINYFITDKITNNQYAVDISKMLTAKQYNNLKYFPDLIIPLALKIKSEARKKFNIKHPKITCNYKVKFMGKNEQLLFSPSLDLTKIPENKKTNKWLFQLKK